MLMSFLLSRHSGVIFAPIASVWLGKVLERVPYKGLRGALTKVALDQSIAAPGLLAVFFTTTTLMEGKSFDDAKAKLEKVRGCMWLHTSNSFLTNAFPTKELLEHSLDLMGCMGARSNDQHGLRAARTAPALRVSLVLPWSISSHLLIALFLHPRSNVVSVFWNTFLALVAGGGGAKQITSSEKDEMNLLPVPVSSKAQMLAELPSLREQGKNDKLL